MRSVCAAAVSAVLWLGFGGVASAQPCGGLAEVRPGDTLTGLAEAHYRDARKWSAIYRSNIVRIGDSPDHIEVGGWLTLPCIGGLPTGLATLEAGATEKVKLAESEPYRAVPEVVARAAQMDPLSHVNLLTADGFAPFADRNAPGGGLVTELVEAALDRAGVGAHTLNWVNDRASHLDPLLSNGLLDIGFPWEMPNCQNPGTGPSCDDFLFSDPVVEERILLFVDTRHPMRFEEDTDIVGRTLCRPEGLGTQDLDRDGRDWLIGRMIRLERPASAVDCFRALTEGDVDAVVLEDSAGRAALAAAGLADRVAAIEDRPLSSRALRVIVHRAHPMAEALIDAVNIGLRDLHETRTDAEIRNRHLAALIGG